MQKNYAFKFIKRRLYQLVDVRAKALEVDNLLGLSIERKQIIPFQNYCYTVLKTHKNKTKDVV